MCVGGGLTTCTKNGLRTFRLCLWNVFFLFLFSVESLGLVPSQLWTMLLLFEKPQGGFSPIGLLPIVIRHWECCRKHVLWDWEAANTRSWAAPGKSSYTLVAHQRQAVESFPS